MNKQIIKGLLCAYLMLWVSMATAQVSGNQVYNSSRYDKGAAQKQTYHSTDSTLSIMVRVLLNQQADRYMITLGVSQEEKTVKACNTTINTRINDFLAQLGSLGIKKDEVYVDFISQTKIYDFVMKTNTLAEEVEKGFVIKKNIIVGTQRLENIEKIITMASEHSIHDIIRVEYSNDNVNSIYEQLFNEAQQIVEMRKAIYLKHFNKKIVGAPRANDSFYYVFPENQYKEYEAYEAATIESNNDNYTQKRSRKSTTFYYKGVDYAGFDKVINQGKPIVGVQYVLTLTVIYNTEK